MVIGDPWWLQISGNTDGPMRLQFGSTDYCSHAQVRRLIRALTVAADCMLPDVRAEGDGAQTGMAPESTTHVAPSALRIGSGQLSDMSTKSAAEDDRRDPLGADAMTACPS